jgi:4,5:9,10-diseco-3-hydroxy-5,9,17-trioxoandrosta-1(10),2-diene-4-oate hydrolase
MEKPYRSSFVNVNGIRTCYVEAGEGVPLVCIHGGGPGASGEHGFKNNIPHLAKKFRVIAPDMLGYGHTDKPPIQYWEQRLVDHVSAFIDTLCLERFHIMGNSMGAYVAAKYTLDHPERVLKLLMISSGSIANAMGLPRRTETDGMKAMAALRSGITKEKMRALLETLVHQKQNITDELVESRVKAASLPGAMEAQRSHSEFRTRLKDDENLKQLFDLTHRLPRLDLPTCLVWGKQDRFAPVEQAYELKKMLPKLGEFHILENSGHQCQNDEVERFNEIALKFFS